MEGLSIVWLVFCLVAHAQPVTIAPALIAQTDILN